MKYLRRPVSEAQSGRQFGQRAVSSLVAGLLVVLLNLTGPAGAEEHRDADAQGGQEQRWQDPGNWFSGEARVDLDNWGFYGYPAAGYDLEDSGRRVGTGYLFDDHYYTDDWYEDNGGFDTWYDRD
jgi:hypothetical protein